MAESMKFYYGDEAGNPVGPLSLDEIRRFAVAGVVPPDVMVCEAGGEHWRSLETLTPTTRSPVPLGPAPDQTESVEPVDTSHIVGNLKLCYSLALISSLVAFGLDAASTRAEVEHGGEDPNVIRATLSILAGLVALGTTLALIYQLVRSLPERHRFTSPLKAAGFFLIPVFSLYWVFRLFLGLAESTRKWAREIAPSKMGNLYWLVPFAGIAAILAMLGEILVYIDAFGFFEDFHPVTTKRIYLLVYLGYAAAEAACFHFTLSLVHLLRGFLDPEDYERESQSEKSRGFLTLRSGKWNPAYAYVFFFIAIVAWR